ncbi:DUF3046 domain-containing protein [Naasia lichenicola]|uniref:DUF3046 domain-containing protein n=1 Tax=Naasia lichenicola TaxID=2565933 RepID=A0A4S4FPS7_9MICO|nr:DUF3046 domain-containing protein [Naasia lichenicola]THG32288.1 DUF3046 domain-containing protein [Naasia lichenicola]
MRLSEFRLAVTEEFGDSLGRALVRDLVVDGLDGRTPQQALDAGVPAAEVWTELCRSSDVPRERWHGRGQRSPA